MSRKFFAIVGFIVACSFLAGPGWADKPVDPQAAFKGFTEFMTKALADWKVPGVAVAVVKDGKVILAEGYGVRDVKNKLKVTSKTLFAIGSSSKAFTAADAGILVDDGKLEWDKPVREYLPTFQMWDEVATKEMTLRDLLCHRSGLPRHEFMWIGSPLSRQGIFDRLRYLEPTHGFRQTWQYQNQMIMTAGYLIGEVSHSSWEDFTRTRIFEPLGMTRASFSIETMKADADHSLPYGEKKDQVVEIPYRNIDIIGPAGSINASVEDMAKWVLMNLAKGKAGDKRIVSEAAMKEIHSPQMIIQDATFLMLHDFPELYYPSYGMGWFLTSYRGHGILHHGGNIDGFSAMVSFMPRENMGLVILTNLNGSMLPTITLYNIYDRLLGLDPIGWSQRFKDIVDKMKAQAEKAKKEAVSDKKPGTTPSHPLDEYIGDYVHPAYGTMSIVKDGAGLKAQFHGGNLPMSHYHYDVFELNGEADMEGLTLKGTFGMDLKGAIVSLSLPLEAGVKDIVFTRQAEKRLFERSFLEKLCGAYDLMGQTVTVALKGENTLTVTVPGQPPVDLVPAVGTSFTIKGVPGASVEFKLDASGAAAGAVLTQGGATINLKKK
jgi:CubicO group peptidase (beta-lactamase class C family)